MYVLLLTSVVVSAIEAGDPPSNSKLLQASPAKAVPAFFMTDSGDQSFRDC